jgi:FkbM family methyltransferase
MKIFNSIIKLFINIFCSIVKSNKSIKQYVFSKALKNEVIDYIENKYYSEYEHIKKSVFILKNKLINIENFIILDIGGSNGKTAIMYSEAFPLNLVYVFEPIKETFKVLSHNTRNYKNIVAVNKAVGNKNGKEKINVAKRISASSLLDLKADKTSKLFAENLEMVKKEEITICKLDNEIPANSIIGIMKIDVQGFELEVLKGAEMTIERTYIVILEVNNHNGYSGSPKYYDIDLKLRESGFFLYDLCPSTRDNGRLKEWDVIYINKKNYEDWNN